LQESENFMREEQTLTAHLRRSHFCVIGTTPGVAMLRTGKARRWRLLHRYTPEAICRQKDSVLGRVPIK